MSDTVNPAASPERLEIRDKLPATASGKIQKFALRNILKTEAGEETT